MTREKALEMLSESYGVAMALDIALALSDASATKTKRDDYIALTDLELEVLSQDLDSVKESKAYSTLQVMYGLRSTYGLTLARNTKKATPAIKAAIEARVAAASEPKAPKARKSAIK